MELRTVGQYARELRPMLGKEVFEPARSRALWFPLHVAIIATTTWALATGRLPAWAWPFASLLIGCSLAGIVFLGHETLHGAVVKGKTTIHVFGWFLLLPFTLSPRLWMAWHNRVHHNHTGKENVDPDMYPTLHEYNTQPAARLMAHLGIGREKLIGYLSLLFGFTGQSTQMLFNAKKRGMVNAKMYRRVWVETVLGWAFWATVAVLVGPLAFVFVYLIPLVVANIIVMAFIMTNHNLSPLTDVNDPLVNSLSVTLPRPMEWVTLNFGFHTEHHLFPTVSTRHGAAVRDAIKSKYAERYQSLPLFTAIGMLHRTARVYADKVTMIDPPSGKTWPTLLPREKAARLEQDAAGRDPGIGASVAAGLAGIGAAAAAAVGLDGERDAGRSDGSLASGVGG